MSTVYISQIENGKTKLSLEMLVNIAGELDTDPSRLLSGSSLNIQDPIPHELAVILHNCSPKKLKLIVDIVKAIDKY